MKALVVGGGGREHAICWKLAQYPIVRPLFYYYDVKNEGKVKPFIDYILSAEGQATVKQVGYIPVK